MSRESIQEKRKRIKIAAMSALAASIAIIGNADDAPIFDAPLVTTLRPNYAAGSYTATFTRATTGYVEDFEGLLKPVLSGEARFKGARREYNYLASASTPSEDISHVNWTKGTGVTATDASTITYDGSGSAGGQRLAATGVGGRTGSFRASFEARWVVAPASTNDVRVRVNAVGSYNTITLSTEWQRYASPIETLSSASLFFDLSSAAGNNETFTLQIRKIHLHDVTGQSNQNPSEYVSVGVLSAPYHGANVDGVKYFNYKNGNTVSSNVVTEATGPAISSANSKFAVLGGANGDTLSTPDKSGLPSGTDIIDVDLIGALDDWTPGASKSLITQYVSANIGWSLYLTSGGNIVFVWSADGSSTVANLTSSVVLPATDRARLGLRCKFNPANGGQSTADFSTSVDGGATWTALGTQRTNAGNSSVYNSTQKVEVFGDSNGSNAARGRAYRMRLYNGDRDAGGTLVLDCNPNDFSSGTTWVSSTTGETWTINGNARIFGGSGSSSIAAPWDSRGPYGYFAEGARTNLCLQSQTLGTTWSASDLSISANTDVAPDGTTTMDRLVEAATTAAHYIRQSITFTNAVHVVSFYAKAGSAGRYIALFCGGAGSGGGGAAAHVVFNPADGTVSEKGSEWTSAGVEVLPGGIYRFYAVATMLAGAANVDVRLANAGTTAAANTGYAGDGTSYVPAWGVQVELGSFASTYIPTTTAAVTRNADVLTYAAAGNIAAAVGSVYCEPRCASNGVQQIAVRTWAYNPGDGTSGISLEPNNATNVGQLFSGGQGTANGSAVTSTATASITTLAGRWALNDLAVYANGAKEGTDSSAAVPSSLTGATIKIGSDAGSAALFGTIRNVLIFSKALSDARLQQLTT